MFIVSRPVGTHIGYILTITALRLTACTVFLKVSPLRGDYRSPLKLKINNENNKIKINGGFYSSDCESAYFRYAEMNLLDMPTRKIENVNVLMCKLINELTRLRINEFKTLLFAMVK